MYLESTSLFSSSKISNECRISTLLPCCLPSIQPSTRGSLPDTVARVYWSAMFTTTKGWRKICSSVMCAELSFSFLLVWFLSQPRIWCCQKDVQKTRLHYTEEVHVLNFIKEGGQIIQLASLKHNTGQCFQWRKKEKRLCTCNLLDGFSLHQEERWTIENPQNERRSNPAHLETVNVGRPIGIHCNSSYLRSRSARVPCCFGTQRMSFMIHS